MERYGLRSDQYDANYEYDLYVRAALPQFEALKVVLAPTWTGGARSCGAQFMASRSACRGDGTANAFCRVYYAHEVPTVRPVVEEHPGHDTMFYNVLRLAGEQSLGFRHVFGDRSHFYKHALLEAAADFPAVFAVGDLVVDELSFLGPQFANKAIDLVYNGIPAPEVKLEAKMVSTERLRQYAENLTGVRPDHVFTHVARLVPSKGLWRDLRVLEELDPVLTEQGRSAVFFVLATAPPTGRSSGDVMSMEAEYGWPLNHREGYPDLVGSEIPFYQAIEHFNRESQAVKAIFANQFGWDQERCGTKCRRDDLCDLRQGPTSSSAEHLRALRIAQFEPCPTSLCASSQRLRCVGFAIGSHQTGPGIVVADYISLPDNLKVRTWQDALLIGQETRDLVERYRAGEAARQSQQLCQRAMPTGPGAGWGQAVCQTDDLEVVVSEYIPCGRGRCTPFRSHLGGGRSQ